MARPSGNPLAVAAGRATLHELDESAYDKLEALGARLQDGLERAARAAGQALICQRQGSLACVYFAREPVTNLQAVTDSNRE